MSVDVIIIGAGHNGLITATRLSGAGKKVLVLEKRDQVGGCAVTEEIHPGFRCSTLAHSSCMFQGDIAQEFELEKYGLKKLDIDPLLFAPSLDNNPIFFWRSVEKTVQEISRFSSKDGHYYLFFEKEVNRLAGFLRPLLQTVLPDPAKIGIGDLGELLRMGWKLLRLKEKDIQQLLRVSAMPIADFLNEYFENDHLKGILAVQGVIGCFYGVRSAGTTFMFLYQRMARGSGSRELVEGGMGSLTKALAEAAKNRGCEIRTEAEVKRILVQNGVAVGVELADGETISAGAVVSNADAKTTFLKLVDPFYLEPHFVLSVRNIRSRGVSAKINYALDRYPQWRGAEGSTPVAICISEGMDYVEQAFDDAKYGTYSRRPVLDIMVPSVIDKTLAPEGKHVMSVHFLYAPYHLRNSGWKDLKNQLGEHATSVIEEYAPGFSKMILARQIITPMDLEQQYGLFEGNIYHGEMSLDQILFMRPVSGYSRYATPIQNLFLCGASTHPGGGVTGLPGILASREILSCLR